MSSIDGDGYHYQTKGATSIYNPSATGFRTPLHFPYNITPAQANAWNWHMNWIAFEVPPPLTASLNCFGEGGVVCSASASGGNGTYTFNWQPGSNTAITSTGGSGSTSSAIGTCVGGLQAEVSVTVTDSNGASVFRQRNFPCVEIGN
jgi:hypothetical protein